MAEGIAFSNCFTLQMIFQRKRNFKKIEKLKLYKKSKILNLFYYYFFSIVIIPE